MSISSCYYSSMARTKQVVPKASDYAVQAHQISRASYTMPVMHRRLVYLAMAQVRPTDSELPEVEMSTGDIARALGIASSNYEEIRAAARGSLSHVLDIDTEDGWIQFQWFSRCRYIKTRDAIKLKLNDELKPYVIALQSAFAVVPIADISRLQGRHALRLFELVMSNRGMAGTGGNKPGCWYYDIEFAHLRSLLKIGSHEYKLTADFRRWVVDGPVREINEANIGIRIECDYDKFREGRTLKGVRLNARLLRRDEPRPVGPATMAENDEARLVAQYPDLYETYLAEERRSPSMFGDSEPYYQGRAIKRLAEHDAQLKAKRRPTRPPKPKA